MQMVTLYPVQVRGSGIRSIALVWEVMEAHSRSPLQAIQETSLLPSSLALSFILQPMDMYTQLSMLAQVQR